MSGGKWVDGMRVTRRIPEPKARQPNQPMVIERIVDYLTVHDTATRVELKAALGDVNKNTLGSQLSKGVEKGILLRHANGNRRGYTFALAAPAAKVAPVAAGKEVHPERVAAHTYCAQLARDEMAEVDRMIAERRK